MARLKYLLLAALVAVGAYGFFHERLLSQPLWTPDGRTRFLVFSAIYWVAAGVLWRFGRRWLAPAAAACVLGWTIWWCGLLAPLATLYLLGSCFFLGRILWREADGATAILLGLAGWMFAIGIALHFAVNTPLVYWLAFAIPYLAAPRRIPPLAYARGSDTTSEPLKTAWRAGFSPREVLASLAPSGTEVPRGLKSALQKRLQVNPLLLYFFLAYWLAALKPEVSADALSMHLALPMAVAHDHRWAFDFRQTSWALMPAGGDAIFTAAYLLGGEAAARLANFGLFVLICAAILHASRRSLAAALFASTPVAFLVTSSLFVENVWAALILGAVLALIRYDEGGKPQEMRAAGALFGAALATKLTAAVFLAPASVLAVYAAWKRRQGRPLVAAAALLAIFALPPYVYAWAKSGNPVFPFANAVFRSPDFDTTQSFSDPRFAARLSWRTPYDASFRSGTYFEGRGGGGGFQYFLLLAPAAIFVRRRRAQLCLAAAAAGAILIFSFLPNLRYLYPALPLFSIAFGGLLDSPGPLFGKSRHNGASGPVPLWPSAFVALAALNAWFLSAAGWYDRDFALFRKSQIASYIESGWPERALIERLNREDSGESVALFSSDAIAGLHARAYSASWHTWAFWEETRRARTSSEVAAILRRLGIRHIIAPASERDDLPQIESFLHEWAEPDGPRAGRMALFRLRDSPATIPRALTSLPPGQYDDLDERIEYSGRWIHDRQFAAASQGTLTYCDVPGAGLRLAFEGTQIDYIFTRARNRGIAEVSIDGVERARIDMYSQQTRWRAHRLFEDLGAGPHVFAVRVRNEKNPASAGTFVDLDAVVVR